LEFFSWLKQRGLRGVDFIVSDSHFGLVKALQGSFQNVTWQRCQTHLMRNLLDSVPKSMHSEVYPRIRAIFESPDRDTAHALMERLVADYEKKLPKAMRKLEEAFESATAVLQLPEKYRKKLRTTNSQERLNEEIRRRDRVIRIYPNQESAFRIVGALLMETHEKWTTGRKYLSMEDYWSWREQHLEALKQGSKVHHLP
jgi:transposase-like protein